MFYLEVRDKKVYMRNSQADFLEPRIITSYWLTTLPNYPEFDGLQLREYGFNVKCVYCFNKKIPVYLVSDYPEFTEFSPIQKPKKRGNWKWEFGEWRKC